MIPVDRLLYKIDQRLNKLTSNVHQEIQLEDKLLALNEAQLKLIEQRLSGIGTATGLGLDSTNKRFDDIQNLVEDYGAHKLTLTLKDSKLNQWVASIENLSPEYLYYVASYVLANKGRCKNRIIWVNKDLMKHGDLQYLLNNDNYKPSFEYQETFNSISSNEISIFTDGTFTPSRLFLMYIRKPKEIDKTGYVKFDGTNSTDVDCELKDTLEDDLLDLTVQNLGMYTENANAVQSAQFRIQTSE